MAERYIILVHDVNGVFHQIEIPTHGGSPYFANFSVIKKSDVIKDGHYGKKKLIEVSNYPSKPIRVESRMVR